MPKIQSKAALQRQWIDKINGKSIYTTDGKIIFCQACEKQVLITPNTFSSKKTTGNDNKQIPCSMYSQLVQHNDTAKHQKNVEISTRPSGSKQKQQFISIATQKGPNPDQFSMDLCNAFLSANIPFNKLNNDVFRKFLEDYTKKIIPNESSLRKNYLKMAFEQV